MRTRVALLGFVTICFSLVLLALGCGGDSDTGSSATGSTATATSTTGSGGAGGGCQFGCTGGSGTGGVVQGTLVISPMDPQLTVDPGAPIPTQAFTVTFNGNDVTSSVQWLFDRPEVGDVDTTGLFTPTGLVGGVGNLTANLNTTATGSTTVTVMIKAVANTGNLTPAQIAAFDSPSGPDPAMKIVYPYDQTVFPLGVLSPEIQWNGAVSGDFYRLRFTEKYLQYTEYFSTTTPASHIVPQADWAHFESSGAGSKSDPVTVELSRMSGTTVYAAATQTWHIAQGKLHGSVYYWELPGTATCASGANGRIVRIKPDSEVVDQFFNGTTGCWGCHTVSRDGTKLAAVFENGQPPVGGSDIFYEINLAANPAGWGDISPTKEAGESVFSAYNNDGTKLLVTENSGATGYVVSQAKVKMLDSVSGALLNGNVLGAGCSEPAWSPDGTKIAGTCGLSIPNTATGGNDGTGWVFDSNTGYLVSADAAANGTVSNVKTIVPQAGQQGRPAYPSFSPGSEWLAYGRPTLGARSSQSGDLWIVAPDGTGVKKLATASSDNKSFNPVFAPLRAGGYFWIVFISRRDYGNQLVGQNRQQLWVTAVEDPPSALPDPSNPPFYLRGQEMCGKSENAYYALDPCKPLGQSCLSGVDCCNGQCIKDSSGNYVCGTPTTGTCSQDGNSCKTSAECCNYPSSTCVDGFCTAPIPK